jgi:hypothetical protein
MGQTIRSIVLIFTQFTSKSFFEKTNIHDEYIGENVEQFNRLKKQAIEQYKNA